MGGKASALLSWTSYLFSPSLRFPPRKRGNDSTYLTRYLRTARDGEWKHSEPWWPLVPTMFDVVLSGGYGVTGQSEAEVGGYGDIVITD